MLRLPLRFAALCAVLAVAEASAFASPASAPSNPQAAAKYADCQRYFNVGDYAQALRDCKAAYLLDPQPHYLYDLAQIYRFGGDPRNAAHFYRLYLASPVGQALPDYKRQAVDKLAAEQEQAAQSETAPPSALGEGSVPTSRPTPAAIPSVHPLRAPTPPTPAAERPPWATDWLGDTLLGAGALGLAAGGITFAVANTAAQSAQTAPNLRSFTSDESDARDLRTVGTWSTVIGGALLVGGIAHLALHGFTPAERPDAVSLMVSPTGFTVCGGF